MRTINFKLNFSDIVLLFTISNPEAVAALSGSEDPDIFSAEYPPHIR